MCDKLCLTCVPSLHNVDTIPKRQGDNLDSVILDDKIIELLDSLRHAVFSITRSIHTPLHTHTQ